MTVFITGGVRNTGLAVARRFARAGWKVALTSRKREDAEKTALALTREFCVPARGYALSLKDAAETARVFEACRRDLGGPDALILCAADLGIGKGILNSTPEDAAAILGVNLAGNFFCCQAAARLMKETGGAIVVIGSVHSDGAVPDRALYTVSKGGLKSLVKSMAVELAPFGIRANYIAAGAIHTERWDELDPETLEKRRSRYPAGRESMPEEIAEAAFFLGTDLSPTVTGAVLTVDSGITACLLPYQKSDRREEK